jgi:hypothetical protein
VNSQGAIGRSQHGFCIMANPGAVAEREASRTKFSGLSTEQATKADGEAFPGVVDEPAGGPPKLPSGQSITGYLLRLGSEPGCR